MNAFAVLAWGDARIAMRELRALVRSPLRLIAWLVYIAGVATLLWVRTVGAHYAGSAKSWSPVLGATVLGAFGVMLLQKQAGIVLFRHSAEARFLSGAAFPPQAVIAYVGLRAIAGSLANGFTRYGLVLSLAIPWGISGIAAIRDLVLLATAVTAIVALELLMVVAPGPVRIAGYAVGVLAVIEAFAIGAQAASKHLAMVPLQTVPHLEQWLQLVALRPIAGALSAAGAGDVRPAFFLVIVTALALAAFSVSARDPYPRLYTQMNVRREFVASRRRRRDDSAASATRVRRAAVMPPGILAIPWKSALEAMRRPRARWSLLPPALLGGALGWFGGPHIAISILPTAYLQYLIVAAVISDDVLERELRRPLFWLSGASLCARLGVLTLGETLPHITWAFVASMAYALAGGSRIAAAAFALSAPFLSYIAIASGVAIAALFPNMMDRRGPGRGIRSLLTLCALGPVLAGAAAAFVLTRSLIVVIALSAAIVVVESLALVALAAWRIGGGIGRYTTVER